MGGDGGSVSVIPFETAIPRVKKGESRVVYIAAPFDQREQARELKDLVEAAGHITTSTWITAHLNTLDEISVEVARDEAYLDLEAVGRCELIILLNRGVSTSGGMHLEVGYGLAKSKGLLIVGEPSNIFHHLPNIYCVKSIHDVPDALTRYFRPQRKDPMAGPNAQ